MEFFFRKFRKNFKNSFFSKIEKNDGKLKKILNFVFRIKLRKNTFKIKQIVRKNKEKYLRKTCKSFDKNLKKNEGKSWDNSRIFFKKLKKKLKNLKKPSEISEHSSKKNQNFSIAPPNYKKGKFIGKTWKNNKKAQE